MGLKIAIVGCGKIADAHVEEIRKIPSVQLERRSATWNPSWRSSWQRGTRSRAGTADVATLLDDGKAGRIAHHHSPQSHLPLTRQAVAAGCHVFLEKPVALRHSDTRTDRRSCRCGRAKTGGELLAPISEAQALELRRLYEAGVLGSPVHIESFYGYDLACEYGMALKRDPDHWVHRLPGKLFQNVLDHILNKIVPFLGNDEPSIQAIAYCKVSKAPRRGAVNFWTSCV